MKKNLLQLLLLLAVLVVGSGTLWAQEDVTATYLTNADFSIGDAINNNVCSYGKDMASNGTSYYGAQPISGWTNASTGYVDTDYPDCGMAGALFEYGSTPWLAGSGTPAPATDPNGNAGKAAGLCAVWGQKVQYTQDVTLPAGSYTIRFKVYNATTNNSSGKFIAENFFGFVPNAGTAYYAPNKTFAIGQWSTVAVTFNLTAETAGKISIGYRGNGSGNATMPHLFVDNVMILKNSGYEDVTNKVGVAKESWTGAEDGLQGTAFKTSDGRDARMAAFYGSTAVGEKISQTVTGLAKGTYEAVVCAYSMNEWNNWGASLHNDAGDVGYVMADGKHTIKEWINAREGTHNANDYGIYTLSGIEVGLDGNLKLAYAIDKADQTEWMAIQIKSLIYTCNVTFDADEMQAIYNASEVDGKLMNKDVKTALDAALATAKATPNSTTYEALIAAINNAQTSIENYIAAKAILDAAATLDAAGQAAYAANEDIAALQTAYDNLTLETMTENQKTAYTAALTAAAKAQTLVAGLDMTLAIVNWDFDTNDATGWTIEKHGTEWDNAQICPSNAKSYEYWVGNTAAGSFDFYQNLTGLPTGKYKVTANMWNGRSNGPQTDEANGNVGVYGSVGSTQVFKGVMTECDFSNAVTETTDEILVNDGTLRVGVKNIGTMGLKWFGVNWFNLTLTEPIPLYNSLAEMIAAAPAAPALLKFNNIEVLHQGVDAIVAQDLTGEKPLGFVIKGITGVTGAAAAVKDTKIGGLIYGLYDAATHVFTITDDPANSISAAAAEATVTNMELAEAVDKENTYQLIKIEMAEVVQEGEDFYAKKNADKIKIDKRLCPALMLYDGEMQNTIIGVTFVEGANCVLAPMSQSDLRSNKAEAGNGEGFAQGESVNTVNGIIMTYGGNDPEGAEYEFATADPSVNRLGTKTAGINTFPVDDEGKAYDPEQKNLPTKGTYYVFTPTKDGQLDVTVDLEQGKKLYVTEDGEALKDFNGITTVTNNMLSFPVEAMKTYYVFANESNLTYYGFSFGLKDAYAKNAVKDIATFKLLPQDNEDGDTLLLKDAVVTYIKGDNVFVEDASGAIVFYQTGIQFYVGQKLNGFVVGKNTFIADDNKLPALKRTENTSYKTFKVTENVTPEAQAIAAIDAQKQTSLARFVKLTDVRARKDEKGFNIFVDEQGKGNSIRFEDRFNVFYELPEVIGSVQGIVGINSDGVQIFWPTSKDVPEGAGLTDAEEALLAEAQKLAEDREAVAVGLLDDAITEALAGNGKGLQAAIDQFKANNADQEKDETAKVATDGWKKFNGSAADLAPDWSTAAVTTFDGRSSRPAEVYEQGEDAANRTGSIIYQDITGLTNGNYKVGFYGTAYFTPGRGFESPMQDNATDVAYVFANNEKKFLTSHIGTSFTEASLIQFDVEVTDGNIRLGLGKEKAGTNWHTTQIYQLTWFATAKQRYAAAKASMQELIAQAEELAADAEKTVGKEELNTALEAAKVAQESIRLNIPEFETEIGKLSAAIDAFNAPYQLLAEAQELAEDRDAVAVGLLDDAIAEAQANGLTDTADLQEAVDQFKANNANNAKATYAADKASMQTLIGQAEELAADEALVNNKEELNTAITAAKAALASNKLTVPEFETEIDNMRQAIADFKEANHMGENTLASGKYVLKNVASGLYWGAGNNWGTRASLLDYSEYQTLIMKPDGTYKMETQVSNGGTKYYFNETNNDLYMDNENPTALTITPIEIEGEETEEIVDFDATFYHNWSEVSGTATDNGSVNGGGVKIGKEVALGDAFWGNLDGAVPFKDYANLTDYSEIRIEGTPGAVIRLMCNRVTDEGPIYEIKPTIPEDGKLTVKISDLMFLNGGTPCDFVALQSIKVPAGWQGGTTAATITSMKLVKTTKAAGKVLYTIANGESCYGYAEENPNDKPYVTGTAILSKGLAANDENALWEIIPATTEALAAATENEPMDATFLIKNPNFGRNNRNGSAWTMEAGNQNLAGGTNENRCAESYHSTFTLSQTLANMPKGVYKMTAQGFYRQDGSDEEHLPVFYANDATQTFPLKTGSENNMNMASESFAKGLYVSEPVFLELAADGDVTIGAKLEGNTNLWCIWDNFQLTYYGANANLENILGGAEVEELQQLRQKATDLMAEVEIAAVKTGLTNALSETANVSGKDAILAAIATLKSAIDPAEASKIAKNVLPKMKELVDATNVYTEEAYNQYYSTWLAKYEAGTLTKAEANTLQDPSVVTGWRAQVTVDDLLMSSWDENVMNWDSYHVNTWSVEGDTDGSNFRVPFIEYWIGDGESLGEKTLTATMNGLEAGNYNVTAWVRVRMKNGGSAPAYGISLQANDGTAVDVAAGEQVGESQFYLKEFTAQGTVGADGVLNIKFNVAADNNISWLSFKNVKFEKKGGEPVVDPDLIEIAQNQGKDLDDFPRAELVEGNEYNTYTANADLTVAFKMFDIDVKDCDYVIVKFAEPVSAGWSLAFWAKNDQSTVEVPAGATEYKYVFADDPKCAIQDGILPQICMLTLWGAQKPLVAKVTGIYKHQIPAEIAHTWDFTKWSDATVANLKADATASKVAGWSDVEKKADAEAGNEPTALSKDNCFWAIIPEGGELSANGVAIEELKGLYFGETFAGNRSLAIAVNYAEVDASKGFGPYNGPAYLWLGGKNFDCFTIPAVKGGTTIKMGVESHKISDARGVKLLVDGNELTDPDGNAVAAPMTYTEQTWQVPAGIAHNVVVKNTNGCHIYFIDAEQDEATLTSISNVKGYDQNDAIYNLRGQKVQGTLKKGLYIKSGRKVVIK